MNTHPEDDTPDDSTGPPDDSAGARDGPVEAMLRQVHLRSPPAALDGRVRRVIRRRRMWEVARVTGLAAAAVLAVAVGAAPLLRRVMPIPPPGPTSPTPSPVATGPPGTTAPVRTASHDALVVPPRPVRVEQTIARVSDEGIVGYVADVPLQRIRRQSVRHVWLLDPGTGERTAVTIPEEEILLIRVRPF